MSDQTAPAPDASDIAERIARFSRSRDLVDLWPDTTHASLARARAEIDCVIRATLADDHSSIRPQLLAHHTGDARALSLMAYSMGVGPLLSAWIDERRIDADAHVARALGEQLRESRRYAERVERELLTAADALLAAGIVPVVFKGFHTSKAYWTHAGVRPFADVDVVVPRERVDDVEAVLSGIGFTPTTRRNAAPYSRHWSPPGQQDDRVHALERPDAHNPWRLDVHDSFDVEFRDVAYARLDRERGSVAEFTLRGRGLRAPAQPLTTLILACHTAKEFHSMRLFRIVELVTVIRRDLRSGALRWDDLMAALDRTAAWRFVFPALALVDRVVPELVDSHVLHEAERRANWMIRRAVRRLALAGGMPRKDTFGAFMWADDPVTFARAVARRFVGYGDRNPVSRWLALLGEVRGGAIVLRRRDERIT